MNKIAYLEGYLYKQAGSLSRLKNLKPAAKAAKVEKPVKGIRKLIKTILVDSFMDAKASYKRNAKYGRVLSIAEDNAEKAKGL